MLYVFHGTDTDKVLAQARKLLRGLLAKRPNAQVFHFESEQVSGAALDELIEARGLFVEKHIIVLKRPFETAEGGAAILARAERFAATENIVVIAERTLLAEQQRTLARHAARVEEHQKTKDSTQKFNVFELSDNLGERNTKALWLNYTRALRAGVTPENIAGTLMWGVRSMLLAMNTSSAEEAGMKPFPYGKAKRAVRNFSEAELRTHARTLIALYHDARRKGFDLAVALERWVLGI